MDPKVKEYKLDSVQEDQVEIKRIRTVENIRIVEYQEEQRE